MEVGQQTLYQCSKPKKRFFFINILGLLWVAQKHFSQCGSVLGKMGAISVLVGTLKGPK